MGPAARVLMAAWPASEQQRVEEAVLSARGLVVVRASCGGVELLDGCTLGGDYRYLGSRPQESEIDLRGATTFTVNTGVRRPWWRRPRRVRLLRVGRVASARVTATAADLRSERPGACTGATHFARAVSVGAVPSVDQQSERCRLLGPSTDLPPPACRRFLRLELAPLAAPLAGDEPPLCPSGWSWTGSQCVEGGDQAGCGQDRTACADRCSGGDLASCARLGRLDTRAPAAALAGAPAEHYRSQCARGQGRSCQDFGMLLALAEVARRRQDQPGAQLRQACDGGFAAACSYLGALAEPGDPGSAFEDFLRGCAGGDSMGCIRAGWASRRARLPLAYVVGLLVRACDGGVADGCFDAATLMQAEGERSQRVDGLLRRACDAGHDRACAGLRRI